ncbi:polyprenyl diphosphate synthase [Oceanicella sp. SM1341]|uniref:polyprenyl diphosphate synthase n=1 Tax=Oceanicella sp. SM1341 TaxID=1548889 RepID=UPI000E4D04F0|nr:polyprenyl diphosphate synthase [Oceanicella sp. SM1341]
MRDEARDQRGSMPAHVAIIMDGNGRWAERRGMSRLNGHRKGAEVVREVVRACPELGLRHLTLFAFSTENWKRPAREVLGLMALFRRYIRAEADELASKGVRVRFIGERGRLHPSLQKLMAALETRTAGNDELVLTIALNYGGRDELARAARALARRVAAGEIEADAVTGDSLAAELDTCGLPDPDLVIRTSGEMRISNFLLWQAAYAEYAFIDALWPDFGAPEFERVLAEFAKRERRFGAVTA